MLNHFGSRQRAQLPTDRMVEPAREAKQEPRGKQVAGAGRVDDTLDCSGWNFDDALAGNDDAAFVAPGHHGKPRLAAQSLRRGVEIGCLIQTAQLRLVGEKNVDGSRADKLQELVTPAVDAKCIRQAERNMTVGAVGNGRSLEKGI